MKDIIFRRLLRTPYSERHSIEHNDQLIAALDIHYMLNGQIAATCSILDHTFCPEDKIPLLLEEIDERLLPEASMEDGNLTFTIVVCSKAENYVQNNN